MATINDVAQRAGVSKATVSRYLNTSCGVTPKTGARIQQAIDELCYTPNRIAQTLNTKTSLNIAMLVNDVANPITAVYVKGAEAFTSTQNYNFILCNTEFDLAREQWYINSLMQKQIDGIIISPCGSARKHISDAIDHGIPFVFITRRIVGIDADYARLDHVDGSYKLTRHLIELGHKRIGAIGRKVHDEGYQNRLRGYVLALEEENIPFCQENVVYTDLSREDNFEAMEKLLSLPNPPTAVYAATFMQAFGVLFYCKEKGLRIPEDIAVVSFESPMEFDPIISPRLTTYVTPIFELGNTAAQMLFERMSGVCSPAREISLSGYLRIGESSVPR